METLAIVPALTMMLPALGPFLLTLALLAGFRHLSRFRPFFRIPDDFAILAGILLSFGLFDPSSLTHFADPERPMDWIPDLVTGTFIVRTLLSRGSGSRLLATITELGAIASSVFILLLPLMRQRSLASGLVLFVLAFLVWISLRLSFIPTCKGNAPSSLLLPVFLILAALSFISPLSGSLLLGQLSGGLAAVLAASLVIALFRSLTLSGIEPGLALGALVLIGRYYAEIPFPVVATLLSAFPAASLGQYLALRIPGRTRTGRLGQFLLPALFSVFPLLVAIAIAVRTLSSSGGGY
jgi:hypothetical protein